MNKTCEYITIAYLLIRIHTGESARVTGLAALLGDIRHFVVGAVGEVSGVGVGCHFYSFIEQVFYSILRVSRSR